MTTWLPNDCILHIFGIRRGDHTTWHDLVKSTCSQNFVKLTAFSHVVQWHDYYMTKTWQIVFTEWHLQHSTHVQLMSFRDSSIVPGGSWMLIKFICPERLLAAMGSLQAEGSSHNFPEHDGAPRCHHLPYLGTLNVIDFGQKFGQSNGLWEKLQRCVFQCILLSWSWF